MKSSSTWWWGQPHIKWRMLWFFTQTDEIESFPLPENNVDENLVSVPYYVDEFENMSDSESATLDLKITAVNADEGLKSIVPILIE